MSRQYNVFAINPGSTSTKLAMFEGDKMTFSVNVTHDANKLNEFNEIADQLPYRKATILNELAKNNILLEGVDAFAARGGGLAGLEGGTYIVNEALLHHARICFAAKHPNTLASQIADDFTKIYGGKAFVVNPPDVDEFEDVARISGVSDVFRQCKSHPLNQKEVAIRHAASIGKCYEDMNLVIAHLGGGISVTAHQKGKMIDSSDAINGEGPMAPTRAGTIPAVSIVKMCFSGKYTEREMYDRITKNGGLVDHLGVSDVREVVALIDSGNQYAKLVLDAMIYQIGKHIGAYAAAMSGQVDAILLTGGIAHSKYLAEKLTAMVKFLAPVEVYAGEFELEALAAGAIRVLSGEEEPKLYTGIPVWNGFDHLKSK